MKLYSCYETGVISEEEYFNNALQFCIVKKYSVHYQEQLSRFKNNAREIYALPFNETPSKFYLGIGTGGLVSEKIKRGLSQADKQLAEKLISFSIDSDEFVDSENRAESYIRLFEASNKYDIVCARINGSIAKVPEGYKSFGFDVTYPPGASGAFSIINDCMFVCMWHGCDEAGTAFKYYFDKLNENGLFNDSRTAYEYMKYYLSFDWSERGEYCICEIFRK